MFSKRRAAIEAELAAVGGSGQRASQTTSLKTRQPKDHSLVLDDLLRRWRDEAAQSGIDISRLPAARSKRRMPTGQELAEALVLDRAIAKLSEELNEPVARVLGDHRHRGVTERSAGRACWPSQIAGSG